MPLKMPHGDEKKDSKKRDILIEERTSERKTRQESEEADDKNQCYGASCCMDHIGLHGLREKKI